jgi:hypothetical protein
MLAKFRSCRLIVFLLCCSVGCVMVFFGTTSTPQGMLSSMIASGRVEDNLYNTVTVDPHFDPHGTDSNV